MQDQPGSTAPPLDAPNVRRPAGTFGPGCGGVPARHTPLDGHESPARCIGVTPTELAWVAAPVIAGRPEAAAHAELRHRRSRRARLQLPGLRAPAARWHVGVPRLQHPPDLRRHVPARGRPSRVRCGRRDPVRWTGDVGRDRPGPADRHDRGERHHREPDEPRRQSEGEPRPRRRAGGRRAEGRARGHAPDRAPRRADGRRRRDAEGRREGQPHGRHRTRAARARRRRRRSVRSTSPVSAPGPMPRRSRSPARPSTHRSPRPPERAWRSPCRTRRATRRRARRC